jgi:hypothetical protein
MFSFSDDDVFLQICRNTYLLATLSLQNLNEGSDCGRYTHVVYFISEDDFLYLFSVNKPIIRGHPANLLKVN